MVLKSALLAAALNVLPVCAQVGFGASWWLNPLGNEGNDVYIVSSNTTLNVPAAPNPQRDRIALWPGMLTRGGGLVQSIIVSFANPSQPSPNGCNGKPGQWCAFASFYDTHTNKQTSGDYVPVSAGDKLQIEYTYDDSTQKSSQFVFLNGKMISTLTTDGGRPYYWDAATECQAQADGAMPAYSYSNTQIGLNKADPKFGSTLAKQDSSDSGLSTPDGGKSWYVDTINISGANCHPQSSKKAMFYGRISQ